MVQKARSGQQISDLQTHYWTLFVRLSPRSECPVDAEGNERCGPQGPPGTDSNGDTNGNGNDDASGDGNGEDSSNGNGNGDNQ